MAKHRKKHVSLAPIPLGGDHGTGTLAAKLGTVLEPMKDDKGRNPNNIGRRRRTSEIDRLAPKLSMRQEQAARAISDAYCRVEALSSGGELKEWVQASPKPDACVAVQVAAQSELAHVMKGVPGKPVECRIVVEHVCWKGLPVRHLAAGRDHGAYMASLKVALDMVANHLRY